MIGTLKRAAATTLSRPDTCCMWFVNSVTEERCLVCLAREAVESIRHCPDKGLVIREAVKDRPST